MSALSSHIRAFVHLGNACGEIALGLPSGETKLTILALGNALLDAAKAMRQEEQDLLDTMQPKHDKPVS